MRKIDYDQKENYTGNTETQVAVDEAMEKKYGNLQNAYEEGFASSHGQRGGTAETNGRVKHPEKGDSAIIDPVPASIEDENPGLADG